MISKLVVMHNYMSTWISVTVKGQGHLLTLVQGHSDSTFSNFFSLETAWPIEVKFHVEPRWEDGEWKWVQMIYVTWPRRPPCPYMVQTLKISLGWWPWNLICSIGYSSVTKFVQMITLDWPWPILQQGQIWSLLLSMGKCLNCRFLRNYWSLWGGSWLVK